MSKTTETEGALEAAEAPETEASEAEAPKTQAPEAEKQEKEKPEAAADEAAEEKGEESAEAEDGPEAKSTVKDREEPAEAPEAVETETSGKGKGGPPGRGLADRLSGGAGLTVAAVLLVLSLAASAFLWNAYSGASDELSTQQQVRTRSAEFARAFLLYENDDLDGWEKRLTALAAPEYKGAIGQAVKMQFPLITSLEASSEVSVRDVFINDFDGSVAKTMVVADSRVSSKDFIRTATGMRLLLELNLVKGEWLVNGLGMLGVDEESMTDGEGNALDPSKIEVPEVEPTQTP